MFSIGGVLPAADPARRHTEKTKLLEKKFAHDVKKMSISARRCRENLNNDRLQTPPKNHGEHVFIYILSFWVFQHVLRYLYIALREFNMRKLCSIRALRERKRAPREPKIISPPRPMGW